MCAHVRLAFRSEAVVNVAGNRWSGLVACRDCARFGADDSTDSG